MMERGNQMDNSGFRGLPDRLPLESFRPSERLRQIIVPVDLTIDCQTSVDYAICFAKAFGSTVNLLYLYHEPYVADRSFQSRGCNLFTEQRRKVFASFYKLLGETRNKYPDSIGYFEYGNPDREIEVIARQLQADLLIVSINNGKWLEHFCLEDMLTGWWLKSNARSWLCAREFGIKSDDDLWRFRRDEEVQRSTELNAELRRG
jgi:hypothetical protein